MTRRKRPLSEQLRQAVENSGLTHYRISKDTGIDPAVISRFMSGKAGMTLASLDKLVAYLDLELTPRRKGS